MFSTLERLEDSGVLYWDGKERRLTVDYNLAVLMMQRKEGWRHFLDNIWLWKRYTLMQEAWSSIFHKEEMKSVRRAKQKFPHLSKADIIRVRQQKREEIGIDRAGELPRIERMEVYIAGTDILGEGKIYCACMYGEDGELVMEDYDNVVRSIEDLHSQDKENKNQGQGQFHA